ncbi:F0F1 ATP synthase subunit B [Thermodesulfobacteriota bacterium]
MPRIICTVLIFCFAFFIMLSSASMAENTPVSTGNEAVHSTGGEGASSGGHGADRSGDYLDLLYRFINFALLVIILFIVVKKTPIKSFLNARSEEIRQKLEDLEREKEEAQNRYHDLEKQLKDFEGKRNNIIDQFRKEGMVEKEQIIADAKLRVKQIIDQSELSIQQEILDARKRLKQDVVELAAQKAQEIIAEEMNEKDQDSLVGDFIERVGKIN